MGDKNIKAAAIDMINMFNESGDSYEFTKSVYNIKISDKNLYDAIIAELKDNENKYNVKYLNAV